MLEPRDRQLLNTALRPPYGFELDFAVGTTYSLDLLTLLTVPLSFAWFDRSGDSDGNAVDSVEVLGSLQKYAQRICVFCQAGRTMWPATHYRQLAFLEESVFECVAPAGGAFHPKVWVLRFRAEDGELRYRALCLSRNLTMARSWDTMLVLDGAAAAERDVRRSLPLADFVAALPGMANDVRAMPPGRAEQVARLSAELRQVEFELPEGFRAFSFWPLGFGEHRAWPFTGRSDRMLVVSPFLALTTLERLAAKAGHASLVSAPQTLRQLARRPAGYSQLFTLDDRAIAELPGAATGQQDDGAEGPAAEAIQLSGLHAKLYVRDAGENVEVWTGSANATDAAFTSNVEFLVQLSGSRHLVGVDRLLAGSEDSAGFRDILVEADGLVAQEVPTDDDLRGTRLVEEGRLWAVRNITSMRVESREGSFDVVVAGGGATEPKPDLVELRCRPASLPADRSQRVETESSVFCLFESLAVESLTTFLCVEVSTSVGKAPHARFVLNLPLEGAPTDRRDRCLRDLLTDRSRFSRFLWLLLADETETPLGLGSAITSSGAIHTGSSPEDRDAPTLFELLLRTLQRRPQRLDDIAAVLKSVQPEEEKGDQLFPPGFEEVWKPVWAIREQTREESR